MKAMGIIGIIISGFMVLASIVTLFSVEGAWAVAIGAGFFLGQSILMVRMSNK